MSQQADLGFGRILSIRECFLESERFHGNGIGGAPIGAQSTPRAGRVVFEHGGHTLSHIAKELYGKAGKWHAIYDANRDVIGDNPDKIYPGQVLKIPAIED